MSLCSLGFKELRSVKSGERNGEVEVKTADCSKTHQLHVYRLCLGGFQAERSTCVRRELKRMFVVMQTEISVVRLMSRRKGGQKMEK